MYAEPNYAVRRHNSNILSLFGMEPQTPFSKGMDMKDNLKPDLALKVEDPKKELGMENKDDDDDEAKKLDKACGDDKMMKGGVLKEDEKIILEKSDDECSHEELKERMAKLRAMK